MVSVRAEQEESIIGSDGGFHSVREWGHVIDRQEETLLSSDNDQVCCGGHLIFYFRAQGKKMNVTKQIQKYKIE